VRLAREVQRAERGDAQREAGLLERDQRPAADAGMVGGDVGGTWRSPPPACDEQ